LDLLLTNGTIVDGTGAPAWHGDVLIQGERISAVEHTISRPDVLRIDVATT
jgi:N-acyl-D-amino-acid deacylase